MFILGGVRYKRQASSNSYAMKQNLPILTNVTYPRFGAYSECIDPLIGATHVVDLTICYDDPEHPPSIVDIVRGRRCCEIHFHYRVHSIAENPDVRTEVWLRSVWQQKDQFLADHYAEMQRFRRTNSARTSLSGSLRSKPSYSSMSPMSLSKEQLNMLSDEAINNTNINTNCPTPISGQQHHQETVNYVVTNNSTKRTSTNNSSRASSVEDLITINNGNGHLYHQNGDILLNGDGDLIKLDNGNGFSNGQSRWNGSRHQLSEDSNFPATPTTDELVSISRTQQHHHLLTSAPFDRTKGRPVVLSWTKLLAIHAFYLLVCLIIYEVFVLLVSACT